MNEFLSKSMALLVFGTGITSCVQQNEETQRPNILFIMTDDHTQQALHAYGHGLKVLGYLEENNLLDNTVVIYTSDQGFYLGKHGWYDKRFMYEQSLSTPLLVRYPREIKAGSEVHDLVLNLDLAPTLLDYAGISKPEDMQGKSWRELVTGKKVPWRDAIYYHYYEYPSVHMVKRHYGVRTDRYKLIHFYYDVDEWEMYDLHEDPDEMNSIYGNPAYSEIQAMLHIRLGELRLQYGDSDELTQHFLQEYLNNRN